MPQINMRKTNLIKKLIITLILHPIYLNDDRKSKSIRITAQYNKFDTRKDKINIIVSNYNHS